jgi:hypothetical protein
MAMRKVSDSRGGIAVAIVAITVLAAGAAWWLTPREMPAEPDAPRDAATLRADSTDQIARMPASASGTEPARHVEELTSAPVEMPEPQASLNDALALRWSGRALLPDGEPAVDVPWFVSVWPGTERNAETGEPLWMRAATGRTLADGRFVAAFERAPGRVAWLELEPEGYTAIHHEGSAFPESTDMDLGDVVLSGGVARVSGRVVDADGQAVCAPLDVYAMPRTDEGNQPMFSPRTTIETDAATGSFRIEGLLAGPYTIRARPMVGGLEKKWSYRLRPNSIEVELEAGVTRDVLVVCTDLRIERQITVIVGGVDGRPCVPVDPACVTLDGGKEKARASDQVESWTSIYRFDDVEPGSYTVEVRDPGHLPWRQDDVRPGLDPVVAELEGSCTLELLVLAADTGQPVETYSVSAALTRTEGPPPGTEPAVPWSRNTYSERCSLSPLQRHEGGRLVVDRLPTDMLQWKVEAPGFVPDEGSWTPAAEGARDWREVRLQRTAGIRGRVFDASALPAAGVRVGVFADWDPAHPKQFLTRPDGSHREAGPEWSRRELLASVTDAGGAFEFPAVAAGKYWIRAWTTSLCDAFEPVEMAAGDPLPDVTLSLPECTGIAGRLMEHGESPGEAWNLVCASRSGEPPGSWSVPLPITVEEDGSFRSGPIAAGTWDLFAVPTTCFLQNAPGPWQPTWVRRVEPSEGRGLYCADEFIGESRLCAHLGSVAVPRQPGERVEFELAPWVPGEVAVRVLSGGEPLGWRAQVEVREAQVPGEDESWILAVGTSEDGWAKLPALMPGSYRFITRVVLGSSSSVVDERRIALAPGGHVSWEVHAELHALTLLLLDEQDDQPLAGEVIDIFTRDGDDWRQARRRADASGRLEVELPGGEVRLARAGPAGDAFVARLDETDAQFWERLMKDLGTNDLGTVKPDIAVTAPHVRVVSPLPHSGEVRIALPAPEAR